MCSCHTPRGKRETKHRWEKWSEGKGKGKFYGRGKRNSSVKREKEIITCKKCSKAGYDEDHYWKPHLELKPKKLKAKEKGKTVAIVEHELGSDSGDETEIKAMGFKSKHIASTSSSKFSNVTHDEDKRI